MQVNVSGLADVRDDCLIIVWVNLHTRILNFTIVRSNNIHIIHREKSYEYVQPDTLLGLRDFHQTVLPGR